jgi:hypothetical protein
MQPAGLLTVLAVLIVPVLVVAALGWAGRDRLESGPASLALTGCAALVAAVAGGDLGRGVTFGARLAAMLEGVATVLLPAGLAWLALLGLSRAARSTRTSLSAAAGLAVAVVLVVYLRQFQ